MRILQAFDFLSLPHGGGTVDIVYKLSMTLARRGHDVTICTGDYGLDADYISALDGVKVKLLRSYFNRHGLYLMPGLHMVDIRDYDVIHLHCYRSIQNAVLVRKAVKHGVPYIVDAHGSTVPSARLRKELLTLAYDVAFGFNIIGRAGIVIAETKVGADEWRMLGASDSKIRLQHPLLDTSEFSMLPERGSFRQWYKVNDSPIILFLGRIHRAKGIDTLINALRYVIEGKDAKLVIAGMDDGYKGELEKLVDRLDMPSRVLFTGHLSGVHKLAALVDADVLVQPSRNEAGARPSLEAIMCETPVIVSGDTGAGEKIASFDGGLLFPNGDAKELAKAIMRVMNNPEDAEARTEKAKEYIIRNLSLENGIARYEELYQEAIS